MIKVRDILTNEDQSDPLRRKDFREKIKDYGIEFVKEKPDIILVHATSVDDKLLNGRIPVIILERLDSACIRNRQHISHPKVVGVIRNSILDPFSLNNEQCFQGRYHCRLIHDISKQFSFFSLDKVKYIISEENLKKLNIGFNFSVYDCMKHLLNKKVDFDLDRLVDVHFIGTVNYGRTTAVSYHRKLALDKISQISNIKKDIGWKRIHSKSSYASILLNTKIVVSPWGLGEMCYRDFEAMYCGCILIKPDTSFVRTYPDIFINNKTYVPCKIDFSDLEEKINYVKNNWNKLKEMRINNRNMLLKAWDVNLFSQRISNIIKKCLK